MRAESASEAVPGPAATGYSQFLAQLLSDRERFFTEVAEGVGLKQKLPTPR